MIEIQHLAHITFISIVIIKYIGKEIKYIGR